MNNTDIKQVVLVRVHDNVFDASGTNIEIVRWVPVREYKVRFDALEYIETQLDNGSTNIYKIEEHFFRN